MKKTDEYKWKIDYTKWFMRMFTAFFRYLGIPAICTGFIQTYELAPSVSIDTVMAAFTIYFIIRMIGIVLNPSRYRLVKIKK